MKPVARLRSVHTRTVALALAAGLATTAAARAESLADAIALAYQTNPSLLAERADLRALDERYVQARAALGPSATVGAAGTYDHSHLLEPTFNPNTGQSPLTWSNVHGANSSSVRVNLSQPVYSGGQLGLEVQASQADVLAGRQILREQEANVLSQVITAYADVLLDRALVVIAGQNVDLLRAQAAEIEAEFAVKEVTATDRAQTQARLIAAQIDQARARDALQNAEASYVATVGQAPGDLGPLPDLPSLPAKVDAAFDAADQLNPSLLASEYTELASRTRLAEAKSADGVQVSLGASYSRQPLANYLRDQRVDSFETTVSVSKTLFSAGAHTSRVRQALEDNNRDSLKIADSRRQVVLSLAKSWNDLSLRRSILSKLRDQLGEEEKAFRGSKLESRIGIRTTIDVLNAEQEFQATKVSLFQVYHDEYLTRAALLAAMGMMQADVIDPSLEPYRPETSFRRVSARTVLPWEGVVQAFDQLGAARPARHVPARDVMGPDRPTVADALPEAPHWSDLAGYLPAPSFK
jgi:TolC family type I secretion outer membrane protein